jgi:hypothetical protein
MKLLAFGRYVLSAGAVASILSACGGSQAGAPAVMQPGGVTNGRPNHGAAKGAPGSSTTAFTVSGRKILLDGTPFFIKGVDYGNTQIDAYADPNPLDNANEKVWQPDLVAMRAAGINAVKVYNVSLDSFAPYQDIIGGVNKLRPYESGKINKFLEAAWNGGDHPIYVVLSIFFGGVNVVQPKYLHALNAVYKLMTTEYAAYPAVMGVSIGSEINSEEFINQPVWWKGLNEINHSISEGYTAANAQKITTTTMVDDGLKTVRAGELAGFKVDTWGLDVYRGRTMGRIFDEIASSTEKPEIMAEYGSSAGYYPKSSARYETGTGSCTNYPAGSKDPPYFGLPPPRPWEDVKELPAGGNPRMDFLVSYAVKNANEIFEHRATNGGVTSGGFYFEWNDEWWKAGWPFKHIGGFEGNKIILNADFPGCYDDQAWFGLNADKKNGTGDPFPRRPADTRVPRPTLDAIKAVWAKE